MTDGWMDGREGGTEGREGVRGGTRRSREMWAFLSVETFLKDCGWFRRGLIDPAIA